VNMTDPSRTASAARSTVPGPTDGKRPPGLWSVLAPLFLAHPRSCPLTCNGRHKVLVN